MNTNSKIKKYLTIIIVLSCICLKINAAPTPQNTLTIPIEEITRDQQNDKAKRISAKLQLSAEQTLTLTQLCEYIRSNWDEWMAKPDQKVNSLCVGDSFLTIHPSANEVCIYLKNHTKMLGKGAFKTVRKAISYIREEEVAVATPNSDPDYSDIPSIGLPISENPEYDYLWNSDYNLYDSSSDYESSSTYATGDLSPFRSTLYSYTSSDWVMEDYEREARILEKIQECPTVIQIYFISFDWNELKQQYAPTIVGKYYNGGTYSSLPHKLNYSLEEKLRICHDLLLALTHVHSLNISHNDLHGGNILLHKHKDSSNVIQGAYLSDFGLASEYEDSEDLHFKGRCYWDRYLLTENLQALFSNDSNFSSNSKIEDQLMWQLLASGRDPQMTTEMLYQRFMTLLPELVDAETAERITQNGLIPRRLKINRDNYVEWIGS